MAADKNEKRETMQEPESQKTHITQIQKPGTQKERVHPIPPTTESKSVSLFPNHSKNFIIY